MNTKKIIDNLFNFNIATEEELVFLIENLDGDSFKYLQEKADETKKVHYQNKVYMRGLIEFTNYCKRDCNYCGIRKSNKSADRYRLSVAEILECCDTGKALGYSTFVLQGGEDPYYTDEIICEIISSIKEKHPDCALTLSIGEKSYESYKKFYDAGADRYLLRHETANHDLYDSLHPDMKLQSRIDCLNSLKEIGYQVGAGFMVGLPKQTTKNLVEDLLFLKNLSPHMIGIGPFIPHKKTPLGEYDGGTVEDTLVMLAITRLLLPKVLLPSTTALGTLDNKGREKAISSGANVVMPNLSPITHREKYELYENKICTGDEAAHCRKCIEGRINSTGNIVDMGRGDHVDYK